MSARNARAWLALARATRNSSVPFLYQTRTLAAVPKLRYQHRQLQRQQIQSIMMSTEAQQQQQSQEQSQEQNDNTEYSKPDPSAQESTPPAPRPGRRSFLKRKAASVSSIAAPAQSSLNRLKPPPRALTMMTNSEKQAFGEMLEALGAGADLKPNSALPTLSAWPPPPPQPSAPGVAFPDSSSPSETEQPQSQPPAANEPTEDDLHEMSQISAIFESVLQDLKERKVRQQRQEQQKLEKRGQSSLVTPYSTSYHAGGDDPAALPASSSLTEFIELRLKRGDFINAQLTDWLTRNLVSTERAVEAVVLRESHVIETALLRAVKGKHGDRRLWDACREMVFPLVRVLETDVGMQHSDTNADETEVLKDESDDMFFAPEEPAEVEDDPWGAEVEVEYEEGVPVSSVVAELYPKMLLAAFRLLNLHSPASPLIGQFRSTIRLMGPTSAVLGGSTGLYNELIYFYWRGCQDLPAVVALMQEMDVTGVEPDARTVRILGSIATQRTRDLKAHWKRNIGSLPRPRNPAEKVRVGRETWWDLAPNRKAFRALYDDDGWVAKVKARVEELRRREQMNKPQRRT
ncbi:uncharacterized protein BO72DRAFT_478319 [Aspergillus fijiensis CBS 313.89]|uniref:Mtf2-like C-terminal domain-containing protein n=1 Tax=Aspergillus fijiensis CBS 313.89 TaxID=1448319 RepID=A0A8G1RPC8_9EURO|nr:uncharacterized protein BO72DRAFT_478319 [Aspergillus fijiensis CBS 313.89]RAK76152.1 hypothetical protein BO72DRAFT_478319 [Aspergillus fijiensis CBS 313.89]